MSTAAERQSALTFRLAQRRYALSLRSTSGVQGLVNLRRIPGAPAHWLGLADWGGHVLNVIDLPELLEDQGVEATRSILRLRDPHGGIAVFIPAHLGLCELCPPSTLAESALFTPLGSGDDALHWIDLNTIVAACSKQAAS